MAPLAVHFGVPLTILFGSTLSADSTIPYKVRFKEHIER
jgi:hypothetical protein